MHGPEIRRLYYSIREVCEIAKVRSYDIKTWEEKYPNLRPMKSKSGRKMFRPNELKLVLKIKKFKSNGCTDVEIRNILKRHPRREYGESRGVINQTDIRRQILITDIFSGLKEILDILDQRVY